MKKLTALFLAIVMLTGILASCTAEPDAVETDPVTDPVTDPATEPETEPATEPDTEVAIGGIALSEYTIVYEKDFETAASVMASELEAICGSKIKTSTDPCGENAISISLSAEELGYDDFRISQNGSSINISGGTVYAAETACERFIEVFVSDKYKYDYSDFYISYTLPDREEYISDIGKLALHWDLYFDTPEWMLDFEEKYAAARTPGGRLMSSAHRGDLVYYPENSVEGIISAIMMGCDMVEIDPRLTKDGVFVLMHDATLDRTTNCREFIGKKGFPRSANVADWTYEQLMHLNLKEKKGGKNAKLTPYKIPTLDEVMKVSAGHILVQLDVKGPGNGRPFWDFEKDIWPLLDKYEMHPQVIFTWHDWLKENNYNLVFTHMKKTKARSNKWNIVIYGDCGSLSANQQMIKKFGFSPTIRLFLSFTDTEYTDYLAKNKNKLDSYKGQLRTYANVTTPKYESQEFYAELYDAGINFQLVDKVFELCTYIADNFEPTPFD